MSSPRIVVTAVSRDEHDIPRRTPQEDVTSDIRGAMSVLEQARGELEDGNESVATELLAKAHRGLRDVVEWSP